MKEFIAAIAAVIVIGICASLVLERFQHSADSAYVGSGTRLDTAHKPNG